jgi:L-ascorbate metabolism protein UlaG (beta-lactamase superfamily)
VRLTFVGHASLLVDQGDVALLCDPWWVGDAFNEGWAPWPAPRATPEQLDRVTHLWISHEHPDHLSIPTLRSIPPDRRAGITVLYQRHWSGEVVRFLRSLGFAAVVELDHGVPSALGAGVDVVLHQVGHEDAALTIRGGGRTVLDLNDCKPSDAKLARMRAEIGPVDVLVDQFSVAGWPGNPEDVERHRRVAAGVLDGVARHLRVVEPRWLVPAASFVRFVSPENAYINDVGNPVAAVVERFGVARTAVLHPGDTWDLDEAWTGSDDALARYRTAAPLPPGGLRRHEPRTTGEVLAAAEAGVAALRQAHWRSLLRRLEPVTFSLCDLGERVVVHASAGVRLLEPAEPSTGCVVEASSQAAWYAFGHRWGLTTLAISGRMRVRGDERPFTMLKQLAAASSAGFRSRSLVGDARSPRGRAFLRRRWRDVGPELLARAG